MMYLYSEIVRLVSLERLMTRTVAFIYFGRLDPQTALVLLRGAITHTSVCLFFGSCFADIAYSKMNIHNNLNFIVYSEIMKIRRKYARRKYRITFL